MIKKSTLFLLFWNIKKFFIFKSTKNNLFILSRSKRLDNATIDMLLELAETKHGYDNAASRVIFTEQR